LDEFPNRPGEFQILIRSILAFCIDSKDLPKEIKEICIYELGALGEDNG
jgi:hypothetical protein